MAFDMAGDYYYQFLRAFLNSKGGKSSEQFSNVFYIKSFTQCPKNRASARLVTPPPQYNLFLTSHDSSKAFIMCFQTVPHVPEQMGAGSSLHLHSDASFARPFWKPCCTRPWDELLGKLYLLYTSYGELYPCFVGFNKLYVWWSQNRSNFKILI